MTKPPFHPKKVKWNDLDEYDDGGHIFRGHKCAEWTLKTSLERTCKRLYGSLHKAAVIEEVVLREFRRRLHHYSSNVPKREETLRWLSLMQHHGAPTRLLDWTYSIYVAAYFALEQGTGDCAVWSISKKWLNDAGRTIFQDHYRSIHIFDEMAGEEMEKQFQQVVIEKEPLKAIVQVNPFQLDERLTIQKGVFLYPCDIGVSFEDNLKAMQGHKDAQNVRKLVIAHNDRLKWLKKLHAMNISRATLFPGLDGFAQSLMVYHPLWEDSRQSGR